ncbi:hypothetical protein LY78DRAFT_336338 [Colletotrichum sublineola]|nr:hypothetical protein LY78DRAFT_336338 [Colletotrichum sublineola]
MARVKGEREGIFVVHCTYEANHPCSVLLEGLRATSSNNTIDNYNCDRSQQQNNHAPPGRHTALPVRKLARLPALSLSLFSCSLSLPSLLLKAYPGRHMQLLRITRTQRPSNGRWRRPPVLRHHLELSQLGCSGQPQSRICLVFARCLVG